MKGQTRAALAAVITAAGMLCTAALMPQGERGLWWGTMYAITCEQAVVQGEQSAERTEIRFALLDWLRSLRTLHTEP